MQYFVYNQTTSALTAFVIASALIGVLHKRQRPTETSHIGFFVLTNQRRAQLHLILRSNLQGSILVEKSWDARSVAELKYPKSEGNQSKLNVSLKAL